MSTMIRGSLLLIRCVMRELQGYIFGCDAPVTDHSRRADVLTGLMDSGNVGQVESGLRGIFNDLLEYDSTANNEECLRQLDVILNNRNTKSMHTVSGVIMRAWSLQRETGDTSGNIRSV